MGLPELIEGLFEEMCFRIVKATHLSDFGTGMNKMDRWGGLSVFKDKQGHKMNGTSPLEIPEALYLITKYPDKDNLH
jgi:hypothetical protein